MYLGKFISILELLKTFLNKKTLNENSVLFKVAMYLHRRKKSYQIIRTAEKTQKQFQNINLVVLENLCCGPWKC